MVRTAMNKSNNFKAPDNSLHCIDEGFEHLLPEGSIQITEDEMIELRKIQQAQMVKDMTIPSGQT